MSEESLLDTSVSTAGSVANLGTEDPSTGGESTENLEKQYKEAEKKIGEQGKELGDFRSFFEEVSPLMDKLQDRPELVNAIMEDKIDSSLVQAISDNKIKIEDATVVTKANEDVKKDLGTKKYSKASPEDIEKLIEDKISNLSTDLKKDIKMSEEKTQFEKGVETFIQDTKDFPEYADDITAWLDEHPDIYDIETAYYAVKGKKLISEKSAENVKNQGEEAKRVAMNAGGGGSQGGQFTGKENVADQLIANISDPNSFN